MHRGWVTLLACVWLAAAQPVVAQSSAASGASADETARQLFAEGIAFVEAEDWVQAEDRFRRVLALRSSHVVSYNLASALVNLERPVEAADLLRSILRAPDADAPTRDAARQLLLQTEPQIGTLTIRVSGDMTDVRFALDDRPLELAAQVHAISVDPGEHTITAYRDDTPLAFERVVIGGSAPLQAELAITLPARIAPQRAVQLAPEPIARPEPRAPVLPAPARPARDDDEQEGGSSFWLWAAGGAAVAAAAVLTVVLLSSGSDAAPVMGDTDPRVVRGRVP